MLGVQAVGALLTEVCTLSNFMLNSQVITKGEAETVQRALIRCVSGCREVKDTVSW